MGYAENALLPLGAYAEFRGQAVDATSIIIAYTRTADANLDGVVNNDDVAVLGANYLPAAAKPAWALGDFEFDGFVGNDDVTLLGAFYNPTAAAPLSALSPAPPVTGESEEGLVSAFGAQFPHEPATALQPRPDTYLSALADSNLQLNPIISLSPKQKQLSQFIGGDSDLIDLLAESILVDRPVAQESIVDPRLARQHYRARVPPLS